MEYNEKFLKEGLTYDDVLLIQRSPTCCPPRRTFPPT